MDITGAENTENIVPPPEDKPCKEHMDDVGVKDTPVPGGDNDKSSVCVDDKTIENKTDEVEEKSEKSGDDAPASDNDESDGEVEEREVTPEKAERTIGRVRKQVQRLSEALSKEFETQQAAKDKVHESVVAQLAQGSGTALGEIPIIEASIRKTKPVEMKILHQACFGRQGAVSEIRSNLRKFSGFTFDSKAAEFEKREEALEKKPVEAVRTALRVLNLEVSGTRTQMVKRLLEFLLKPAANMVKYKGKLPPSKRKSVAGRKSVAKKETSKTEKKRRTPSKRKSKPAKDDENESAELSDLSASEDCDESEEKDAETGEKSASENGSDGEEKNSDSDGDFTPTRKAKKTAPKRKRSAASSKPAKKRRVAVSSESEEEKEEVDSERDEKDVEKSDSDDDIPLAKIASPAFPTDEELRKKVTSWLETANLSETSMKVVRTAISNQYKGIDLSSKKQFMNDVIKEYLSGSSM